MNEISPEVWHEFDEARKAMNNPTPETYDEAAENLTDLWGQHYNALIDAARPKCGTCKGTGDMHGVAKDGDFIIDCPVCLGAGWAR